MTHQQLIEVVKEVFPNKAATQITLDLNAAYSDFVVETELLQKQSKLSLTGYLLVGGERRLLLSGYDQNNPTTYLVIQTRESGSYQYELQLPTDSAVVLGAMFYDTSGILLDRFNWAVYQGNKFVFAESDYPVFEPEKLAEVVGSIKLVYVKYPTALSALSDVPEIPHHLHRALAYRVLVDYSTKEQQASTYFLLYEKMVRKGRRLLYDNKSIPVVTTSDENLI